METIGLFVVGLLVMWVTVKGVKRWLKVDGQTLKETDGWKWFRRGRLVMTLLFLAAGPLVVLQYSVTELALLAIGYFLLVLTYSTVLQWLYLKDSNRYLYTMFFMVSGVLMMLGVTFLMSELKRLFVI